MSSLNCPLSVVLLITKSARSDWDKELRRGGGFDFGPLMPLSATSLAISSRAIDVVL
jgi:hypothetical protein